MPKLHAVELLVVWVASWIVWEVWTVEKILCKEIAPAKHELERLSNQHIAHQLRQMEND